MRWRTAGRNLVTKTAISKPSMRWRTEMVITGTLDAWDEHTPFLDDEVLVSLFDEVQFACGDELYNIEYQDTGKKTRFSKAKLDKAGVKAKNVVVAKAYGNSNYPLITDGATIAYDTSKATERLKEDKFYAMEVGGGLKIKTVRFLHDNNIEICTHNRDYPCITLTKKEFEILLLLVQNKGRVFSREDILARIWSDEVYVLDRTIDVNITRLRKKIGVYGKCIVTRLGYGYCFEAE